MTTEFLGKQLSGPFTIPSGIVTTAPAIIQRVIDSMPEIGVITTKSIGKGPRLGNREPVYSQFAPGCFVNAVGLTNPGVKEALKGLKQLDVPKDRFLLVSIFGGSVEEFVEVATQLAPVADGLELNLSCPHAKGYGMAMGQDPEMVREVVAAVCATVDIPVIPKLTPNVDDIAVIGRAAVEGGAAGLCAINTAGPGYTESHGHPVLSNGMGGMSGKGVLPLTLKALTALRAETDLPLIGCGGLSSAADCRAAAGCGATIFGIGSGLTGMNTADIAAFFATVANDLESGTNQAGQLIRFDVDMAFKPYRVVANDVVCEDITVVTLDCDLDIRAGEYVFVWIPGVGEKPFSCLTHDPVRLAVINVGEFTERCYQLAPGDDIYLRGPHGVPVTPPSNAHIVCVAGGTGLAAVYQVAEDFGSAEQPADLFVGARTANRLYFRDECDAVGRVTLATDDGSAGFHGRVSDALDAFLARQAPDALANMVFYNCGPAPMIHASEAVQNRYVPADRIFSAIDYLTKCGVGICGACASPDGRRICVDGPFITSEPATAAS
ncbi:MAG: tRNA-dihydrouridine synthase [Pseudomonadota bacterium]|nr:tRNA-dihydrouridine synthase [Pseudomonadota bacterium]